MEVGKENSSPTPAHSPSRAWLLSLPRAQTAGESDICSSGLSLTLAFSSREDNWAGVLLCLFVGYSGVAKLTDPLGCT